MIFLLSFLSVGAAVLTAPADFWGDQTYPRDYVVEELENNRLIPVDPQPNPDDVAKPSTSAVIDDEAAQIKTVVANTAEFTTAVTGTIEAIATRSDALSTDRSEGVVHEEADATEPQLVDALGPEGISKTEDADIVSTEDADIVSTEDADIVSTEDADIVSNGDTAPGSNYTDEEMCSDCQEEDEAANEIEYVETDKPPYGWNELYYECELRWYNPRTWQCLFYKNDYGMIPEKTEGWHPESPSQRPKPALHKRIYNKIKSWWRRLRGKEEWRKDGTNWDTVLQARRDDPEIQKVMEIRNQCTIVRRRSPAPKSFEFLSVNESTKGCALKFAKKLARGWAMQETPLENFRKAILETEEKCEMESRVRLNFDGEVTIKYVEGQAAVVTYSMDNLPLSPLKTMSALRNSGQLDPTKFFRTPQYVIAPSEFRYGLPFHGRGSPILPRDFFVRIAASVPTEPLGESQSSVPVG